VHRVVVLPESVRPRFIAAGWHPGRRVAVSSAVPADHPAAEILAAFGGLTITPDREAGEECAPDDLVFRELWPDESITVVWAKLLGTRLIGVADMQHAHGELYVAADGRCFGRSCIHDAFYFEGASFADAAEASMLGRRAKPLLRPDQASVTLYGDRFTADSPEVYRYA
jgi:SUKH-3 immunity protein